MSDPLAFLSPEARAALEKLVDRRIEERLRERDADEEQPPYLTVVQYAERHHATPAAVRARIRRGSLQAIRPPGGREYLIPRTGEQGGHGD